MLLRDFYKKTILTVNKIVTSIVLTIIFLCLITPISILFRIFKRNHMVIKNEVSDTYWIKVENFKKIKQGFKKQF